MASVDASRAWRPPRLRLADPDGQPRRATWLELLYDLVFVAAVAQLAHLLVDHLEGAGVLEFTGLFVPVWWAWAGQTFYANRFDTDDLGHRLLAVTQMVAVAALAASAHDALGRRATTFVLAYVALRCVLIFQYLRVRRHVPQARALTTRYMAGFALAAGLWLASLAVPAPGRYLVWALAMVLDIGTPLTSRRLQAELPPQPQHLPERFGLFVIIVLGESVAGIVVGLAEQERWVAATLVAAGLSMVLALCVWWLYFENLRESVVRRTMAAGQIWVYAHLPLAIAVTAVGAALKLVVKAKEPGLALPPEQRWLLAGSIAAVLALLAVLHSRPLGPGRSLPRLASALACVALAALGPGLPAVALLGALTLATGAQVVLDLYHSQRPQPLHHTEEPAHG